MRFLQIFARCSVFVPIALAMAGAPSRAQEPNSAYYMVVFSAQAKSNDPRLTHTFATFVKVDKSDPTTAERTEIHTISWLPRSLNIVLFRRHPEPGANLDLESSLRWAVSRNFRVSMWGPYEIDKGLYDRAVRQEAHLNSGRVLYKALDRRFRPGIASNCIHAVSDLDIDNGLLNTGLKRGDAASRQVAQHLNHWVIAPERTHPWVASRLGVKEDHDSPRDPEQRYVLASR
jgi:hypothetical protein